MVHASPREPDAAADASSAAATAGTRWRKRLRPRKPGQISTLIFVRDRGVIVLWLVMMGAFSIWAAPTFGTFNNFMLILEAASITGIFAAGVAFGVMTGLLDLSLPGTAAVTGIVVAKLLGSGTPVLPSLVVGLAIGAVIGLANGLLTLRGLNALVVTIGMFSALSGLAAILSGGNPVGVTKLAFVGTNTYARIPGPALAMLAVFLLGGVLMTQTRAGVRLVAVGGNAEATRRAGIRTNPYVVLGFVLVSVCAAVGGIVVAGFTSSATPVPDPSVLFTALTAVALSGMPFSGGRGSFPRVIFGALIIATIASALQIENIQPYWSTLITGVLLIAALGLERVMNKAVSRRLVLHNDKEAQR